MEKFRPWLAEFIGTFALIFVGIGAIKTAGHDVLGIALAHGLTIAVFASATMHISGGNLNPAVTFGLLVGGQMDVKKSIAYWISQLAGGTAAFFAYNEFRSKSMFPKHTVEVLKADKIWIESEARTKYGRVA